MEKQTTMSLADELRALRAMTSSPVLRDVIDRAAAALEAKDEALRMAFRSMEHPLAGQPDFPGWNASKSAVISALRAGEGSAS